MKPSVAAYINWVMTAQDKLIVALDVDNANRALDLFEALHGSVGMFKIGMQLFTAAGPNLVRRIIERGGRVFLDLKYHDIPNTVALAAVEATRLGVSLFNIHTTGGVEMMRRTADAVAAAGQRENLVPPKLLGVTLLTSIDREVLNQIGIADDAPAVVARLAALAQASGLDGVVASAQEIELIRHAVPDPNFLIVTPGIRGVNEPLQDQRRVMTPRQAIQVGADYLVVGRPILSAVDPAQSAQEIVSEMRDALAARPDSSEVTERTSGQNVQSA